MCCVSLRLQAFLFSREPEVTLGNLRLLQQEQGLQGRHAAGEDRSGDKWEQPLKDRSGYSRRNSERFYLRLIWIFLKCFTVSWGNYFSVQSNQGPGSGGKGVMTFFARLNSSLGRNLLWSKSDIMADSEIKQRAKWL